MTQIFISYSQKDREFVQRLMADLQARLPDVEVFYDMLIEPGASWAKTLAAQIERADIVLAVLSPDYLQSAWAQQELYVALDLQLRQRARLLPLMVRPCMPTGFLSQLTWVDFTEDYEEALARLIWGITGEQPRMAKGEQQGVPTQALDQREVNNLRRQVDSFKSGITAADVILADLTGKNANVFYEVGICH